MCVCFCDELRKRDHRYVSTRMVTTPHGMIITGIRFVKLENVIHLQIQIGKLMPGRNIDQNSVRWQPINPIENINYRLDGDDYALIRRETIFDLEFWMLDDNEVLTGRL